MDREGEDEERYYEVLMNEVEIMKKLNHVNVVNLIEFNDQAVVEKSKGSDKNVYFMALELASGGELFDFIAQTGKFSDNVARYYFHQLLDGFEYMHTRGISHRDMKPENILLDSEFTLKIADFGYSSMKNVNETWSGTANYMAPEIHKGKKYSGQCVDLFAAGIILFIMIAQRPPFVQATTKDHFYKCIHYNREDMFWQMHITGDEDEDLFSDDLKDILMALLQYNSVHRPSLAEIKEMAWYNGPMPTDDEIIEEFKERKRLLDEGNLQGDVDTPNEVPSDSVFEKGANRSIGDKDIDLSLIKREAGEYVAEFARYTQFFSTSSIKDLWNTLALFADSMTSKFEFDNEEYSVNLTYSKEDKTYKQEMKVDFHVNILKVPYEDKYCVEAVKDSGDRFVFNSIYNDLKEFFGGHVNAQEA